MDIDTVGWLIFIPIVVVLLIVAIAANNVLIYFLNILILSVLLTFWGWIRGD